MITVRDNSTKEEFAKESNYDCKSQAFVKNKRTQKERKNYPKKESEEEEVSPHMRVPISANKPQFVATSSSSTSSPMNDYFDNLTRGNEFSSKVR